MPVKKFKGLPNGYSIKNIQAMEDRKRHNEEAHENYTCITSISWDKRLAAGEFFLYALHNDQGEPICTLLFGETEFVLQNRAGVDYAPYAKTRTYDQKPRNLDGKSVILLECIPRGRRLNSDFKAETEEAQIAKEWWENLDISEDYIGWDTDDERVRTAASEFIRNRGR